MLTQARLVLTIATVLAAIGVVAWFGMPRQEDPPLSRVIALVTVEFPGADAETVERLVVEPLEDELGATAVVRTIDSVARTGVAIIQLRLHDWVSDRDDAWDTVERAVARTQRVLPAGAGTPVLDRGIVDQDAVVLAVTGSSDVLALARAAETVEHALLSVGGVERVRLIADPGEQVTIEYDETAAMRLGLDARTLALQLGARNATPVGGEIRIGTRVAMLAPSSEFRTIEEIANTPILLPSGTSIPLREVARVRHGPAEPARQRMRVDGAMAVGIGVVARDGVDLVEHGEAVREVVAGLRDRVAPLQVVEVAYQPRYVEARLSDLGTSLLMGVAIVAAVLFILMGLRMGTVVASIVPMVALASLGVYAAIGGLLHQISIAALVISLGMLVDNAIVVAENIQLRLDAGATRRDATRDAVRELALPLATATGTTLAAFVPMLLAEGATADFTRALPIVIIVSLSLSYLFAIGVTPAVCRAVLVPAPASLETGIQRFARRAGKFAVRRHRVVLSLAALAVLAAGVGAFAVERRFFPESDRNIVVVDVTVPEGTHLDHLDAVARRLEQELAQRPDVRSVSSFIGRSAPHFYYNLIENPFDPRLAQVVVETHDPSDNQAIIACVRALQRGELAGTELVAKTLEQGPPVPAPIEVRLLGDDLAALREASALVSAELERVAGAVDVRQTIGGGAPTISFEIDDAAASRRTLSRNDVALALVRETRGLPVGEFRGGEDPVPIYVRGPSGDMATLEALNAAAVAIVGEKATALEQVAEATVDWRSAEIRHRDRVRTVSVLSSLEPGIANTAVVRELVHRLENIELPQGVSLAYGGANEGSQEANEAMLAVLPVGVLLLLGFLMVEFNSFRRVAIIMITVPLSMTGVVPGLLVANESFGFMSLLGSIALGGVVVNNAIVVLDVIERRRDAGFDTAQAIVDAVALRTRPILLTTATTIAGLLPLACSRATLWPPLAWTMITGLVASTALTLLVVPALYVVLFRVHRAVPRPVPVCETVRVVLGPGAW
jgi:multidrug efflux pump subunit AcrB